MITVLLIDDDQVDRLAVKRLVQAMPENVELVEAHTAGAGIALAETRRFDCVLLDYSLPDMAGIDVLRRLVKSEHPIVILTGRNFEETAMETLRAGAQEYVEKQQLNAARLYQAIRSSKERQDLLMAHRHVEAEKSRLGQIIEESASEIWVVDADSQRLTMTSIGAKKNLCLESEDKKILYVVDLLPEYDEESFNSEISPLLSEQLDQVQIETEIMRLDGSSYTAEMVLQISKTVKSTAVVFYISDLTERIASSEKIRQMQKMESLGIMTGGIAHDFNNMLTSVVGGLGLLERQELSEKSKRYLSLAQGSVDRAVKLTSRLLAFSRLQILKPKLIESNQFIKDLLPLLESSIDGGVDIQLIPSPGRLYMKVDEIEFESCLFNLCINSKDAMENGGEIRILVSERYMPETKTDDHYMAQGNYVVVTVVDNGSGMDEDALRNAFDPFFTTKAVGKGSGLGLSMVFGFVRQSGGNVTVESELGKGASISLYFPMSKASINAGDEAKQGSRSSAVLSKGYGQRILLVEDDREIREFAVLALDELGYQVTVANNGDEALEKFGKGQDFDLLFTDIVMPGELNGVALAEKFKLLYPSVPVIYTSGYTRNAILPDDTLPTGSHFLSKPYTLKQLGKMLNEIFTSGKSAS